MWTTINARQQTRSPNEEDTLKEDCKRNCNTPYTPANKGLLVNRFMKVPTPSTLKSNIKERG